MEDIDEINAIAQEVDKEENSSNEEENSIITNCNHIDKFISQLAQADFKKMTMNSQLCIKNMKEKLREFLATKDDDKPDVKKEDLPKTDDDDEENLKERLRKLRDSRRNSSSDSSNDDEKCERSTHPNQSSKKKLKKVTKLKTSKYSEAESESQNKSIMEILVDKLDNRKVPPLSKFDGMSGQHLEDYFGKFEKYCHQNIKGDEDSWLDELEDKFTGETLQAFQSIKDVGDSYRKIKSKMLCWFEDMKDLRKKNARQQFEVMKFTKGDTLYLYSTKLEKTFKRAYPNKKTDTSSMLREKFVKSIPKSDSKQLSSQLFSSKLNDKSMTWSSVQKFARCRDVWIKENKNREDDDDEPKEILINVNETKEVTSRTYNKPHYDYTGTGTSRPNPRWRDLNPPELPRYQGNYYPNNQARRSRREDYTEKVQRSDDYRNDRRNANDYNRKQTYALPPQAEMRRCYNCDRIGHLAANCRSKRKCYKCGREGHSAFNCFRNSNNQNRRSYSQPPMKRDHFWKNNEGEQSVNALGNITETSTKRQTQQRPSN